MSDRSRLLEKLRQVLGTHGLLDDAAACHVYARDASHMLLGQPWAVALPRTAFQVQQVVDLCRQARIPLVCRGTGTGLSGGAVPHEGSLVLATSRMHAIGPANARQFSVSVQPGALNTAVTRAAQPLGLHFAPDPSSQSAASIGGNIAENAGGPHCLRHGVTLQHVQGLDWVDAQGLARVTGRAVVQERGFQLDALLCGSEGTLGIITAARLGLVPDPSAVATLLAFFPRLEEATGAVVNLLGAGLLPVAVEMVDQAMLAAVEKAFAFGFPTDVAAAMICELAGSDEEVAKDGQRARELLLGAGAREVRQAVDEAERLELWKCRKKAFGAVGRLAPSYVTMDVVVPLAQLPRLVDEIQVIKARHGVEIATAFHAGDGNLHPGVHYDNRDPDETRRAHAAADEIIRAALQLGGSCTGEHGVGIEKLHAVAWQTDRESARLQRGLKSVFDPANLLNPGKALAPPTADWGEMPPVPEQARFAWDSLTVTAPAHVPLKDLQRIALPRNLWIPLGFPGPWFADVAMSDLINHLGAGPALLQGAGVRDQLLELWARTGDGHLFHSGAPVFKNVAGYDLTHALCGAGGHFATPLAATWALRPAPEQAGLWRFYYSEGLSGIALEKLLDLLARRSAGTSGATLILDEDRSGGVVLAAGRDRPWDLASWGNHLEEAVPGLKVLPPQLVPFARASALWDLPEFPGGLAAAGEWSSWQPDTSRADGPLVPSLPGPLVWQSRPQMWWVPTLAMPREEGVPGFMDPVLGADGFQPLPIPEPGVPRDLLREIKRLFDPQGDLGGPRWLVGEENS
jgi:glycolate oxidase